MDRAVATDGEVQRGTGWLVEDRIIRVIRRRVAIDGRNAVAALEAGRFGGTAGEYRHHRIHAVREVEDETGAVKYLGLSPVAVLFEVHDAPHAVDYERETVEDTLADVPGVGMWTIRLCLKANYQIGYGNVADNRVCKRVNQASGEGPPKPLPL